MGMAGLSRTGAGSPASMRTPRPKKCRATPLGDEQGKRWPGAVLLVGAGGDRLAAAQPFRTGAPSRRPAPRKTPGATQPSTRCMPGDWMECIPRFGKAESRIKKSRVQCGTALARRPRPRPGPV
eukprot:ctg_807.g429